jgi:hypothetical protein
MINGIFLSEIPSINLNQTVHYKKLQKIVNTNYTNFSSLDRNLQIIIKNKKFNHVQFH